MRAYTTEQATTLSRNTRTAGGLGDLTNPNDIPSDVPLWNSGTFYLQDFAPYLLAPGDLATGGFKIPNSSSGSISNPPPIMGSAGSPSGLLIGLGILALVMLSGGGHGH